MSDVLSPEIDRELLRVSIPLGYEAHLARPVALNPGVVRKKLTRVQFFRVFWLVLALGICTLCALGAIDEESRARIPAAIASLSFLLWGIITLCCWKANVCPNCGEAVVDSLFTRPPRWCGYCDYLLKPEELSRKALLTIDDLEFESETDSATKVFKMLLLIAMQTRIQEFLFEPRENDYRLWGWVAGRRIELEPPPPHLHRRLVVIGKCLLGLQLHDAHHKFDAVRFVHPRCHVRLTGNIEESPPGELIRLRFDYEEPPPVAAVE